MDKDFLLRVQCLCNYMEEAAGTHVDRLGAGSSRLARDNLAWVLARFRLNLVRRPRAIEKVRVTTWPVYAQGLRFRRDFILRDARHEVLATAVTQWVVMDLLARKPVRFPAYIMAMEEENPPLADERGDIRVPAPGDKAIAGPSFSVRSSDIDQNGHVNNNRYVDFVLECAEEAGQRGELRRLEILFRAEGLRHDVIESRSEPEPGAPGSYLHSLFRVREGRELARARTIFTS